MDAIERANELDKAGQYIAALECLFDEIERLRAALKWIEDNAPMNSGAYEKARAALEYKR